MTKNDLKKELAEAQRAAAILAAQLERAVKQLESEVDWEARALALERTLVKERGALARFLVPHRDGIAVTWKKFLEDEGGVYFDAIGFVYPRAVEPRSTEEGETA